VVLTAAYILWAIQRVYLGAEYKGPHGDHLHDMKLREWLVAVPLFVFAILFGVFPHQTVLKYMDKTIDHQTSELAAWTRRHDEAQAKPAIAKPAADAARAVEEKTASARAEVHTAAFGMPLEEIGLKEHVFNILVEAGFDTVGALMMAMKMDANRVLGLPGVGPKAMQNIEEALAALSFPEPLPVEPVAEPVAVVETQPEAVLAPEPLAVEEVPVVEKQVPAKKDARKTAEEEEDEHAKDGVSLDELFAMKPEIFQTAGGEEEDSADKKKSKKGKKKSVELVLDEERGEVVGRKKHKRGDDDFGEEE